MKRKYSCLLICLMVTVCVAFVPASAVSAETTAASGTVKVAVLNNSIFAYKDKTGVWRGTDVETMISIAQKTGLKIEFVDSSTDPDFLGNLDKGKYDIVADVVKTSDRKGKYLFTDETIGTINNTLAVRADDNRWSYGNIDQLSKMKIGVLASYANNNEFRAWCREHNVTPVIREYSNIKAMSAALKKGRIDGEIYSADNGAADSTQFHTIMKLLPEAYYFAFRKDDVALKNKVDEGLSQILSANLDYLTNLKSKYETRFGSNMLPISAEENAYIKKHPVVDVGVISGDTPYYKPSDKGIIPDYYKLIADYSGLKFRYKTYDTQKELINAVRNGSIDVIGLYMDGMINAYQNGLTLTDSFTTVNNILMTKQGQSVSGVKRVAVKKAAYHSLRGNTGETLKNVKIVGYESADDCFVAMRKGNVDAMIIGLPSATWLINQHNSTTYSVSTMPGVTSDICSALGNDNQTLCSILNKSIAATKSSFNGIVTRDTLPQNDWRTAISRIPPAIVAGVVLALMLLVIGLAWTMFMLRRRQRERGEIMAAQAEARLQKVQADESRKSVDEKNAFFSNISHDMRTPLNAMIGFTHMAREADISDEQRNEYLQKVESSGALLLDLINDTLVISKVNSGKLELDLAPVDIYEAEREIITPIREIAEQKNISLTVDRSQCRNRTVMMDKLNIQKIFLNILNNSVKYTPDGGHIRITVKDVEVPGGDPDISVSVQDDGIGIDEDFLPRIFEPFSQEKRHGYESVGTGLGLSIVRQLVDLMGGSVDVESEKNKGAKFTVRLHLDETEAVKTTRAVTAMPHRAELKGRKVLLCEDNKLNQEIATALLSSKGISVDVARDGAEGVEMFSGSDIGGYDAILMDVRMPNKSGIEATREIRGMDRADAAEIPVIAMTADAFDDDIRKCIDAGMDAHISKPIDPDKLFDTLGSMILNRGGAL